MNKEETVLRIGKQVMEDFKNTYSFIEYFPDTFKVFPPKPDEIYPDYRDLWAVFVDVPNRQFGGTSSFAVYIKDETMEPFMFHDGGAEGRTPDIKIIVKNGKYHIGEPLKNI